MRSKRRVLKVSAILDVEGVWYSISSSEPSSWRDAELLPITQIGGDHTIGAKSFEDEGQESVRGANIDEVDPRRIDVLTKAIDPTDREVGG